MVNIKGLEYYLVGGAVRDMIMGNKNYDEDFVVVGSSPEEMKDRGFDEVGVSNFPVFLDEYGNEFALARTESKSGSGYKGFDVCFDGVTLKEDLKRRDLTINAIAFDMDENEIIDPFGGKADIEARKLRPVSESFKEDPIRALRLARYTARFVFEPTNKAYQYASECSDELDSVPFERILKEIQKTFMQARKPSLFLRVIDRIMDFWVIDMMKEVPAGPTIYHQEGSVFEHTLRVMDEIANKDGYCFKRREMELWMAFAHDIGKLCIGEAGFSDHRNHEKEGVKLIDYFCEIIDGNVPKSIKDSSKFAAKQHGRFSKLCEMKESTAIQMVKSIKDTSGVNKKMMFHLLEADWAGRAPEVDRDIDPIKNRTKRIEHVIDRVDGKYIKAKFDVEEGPKVGDLILQERVKLLREFEK